MTVSFISCLYGKKQKEEIYITVEDPYNLHSKELQNHLRGRREIRGKPLHVAVFEKAQARS